MLIVNCSSDFRDFEFAYDLDNITMEKTVTITTMLNRFIRIKDYFLGNQNENVMSGETCSQSQRNIFGSEKRPASPFEPEITDDEDDIGGSSSVYFQLLQSSKRLRSNPNEFTVISRRHMARGSEIQSHVKEPTPSSSGTKAKSGLQQSGEIYIQRQTANIDKNRWPQTSTSPKTGTSHYTPIHMENKSTSEPSSSTNTDVEVITIDDDDQPPKSKGKIEIPPSQREMPLIKRPASSHMKKQRDSNRFTRALESVGKKVNDTARSNVFRLKEREQYKQLLRQYVMKNISENYQNSFFDQALMKSKVERVSLDAMYKRFFNDSPTQGNATLRNFAHHRTPGTDLSKLIRHSEALLIEKNFNPIVSYKKQEYTIMSQKKRVNFSNLEEALHAIVGPNSSSMGTWPADKETDEANEDENADMSIIIEKIMAMSRKKCVNTLALEQSSSPYVDKKCLVDAKSLWIERQKQREARIKEKDITINLFRQESTIDKEHTQRTNDKLTLTEIRVAKEPPLELPELTEDMWKIINYAKMRGNDSEVLAQVRLLKDTIGITRGDIKTLFPSQWLNDNVINTYIGLIVLRSKLDNYPNVYAFQTFFYPKLLKEGYSNSLKRWTRKDDIFAHDLIILPIHLQIHWCLACIDLRNKTIKYFDSVGSDNNKCLNSLLEYLFREMKERKQVDLNKSEWKLENVKGIPQQQNESDCGMFTCKFAEYLSREADFSFTQENMNYYRNRMIYELLKQDLLYP